jgi:preprotein translocase subunit SecG
VTQTWRRFAHGVAWFALVVAVAVIVLVLLSR